MRFVGVSAASAANSYLPQTGAQLEVVHIYAISQLESINVRSRLLVLFANGARPLVVRFRCMQLQFGVDCGRRCVSGFFAFDRNRAAIAARRGTRRRKMQENQKSERD